MLFRRTILSVIFCLPLGAADQWVKVTTPHFELFTTAGEKKGREAILYFEQVRSFFMQASPSKSAPEFPVRIVAFRGEKQYQPYRINEFAFAYYTKSRERDYIVMQDIVSEHYPVAIHEYMHLLVEHSGLKMPIWLNEGWADLNSTLKPQGKKAVVGDILPGRAQTLLGNSLIPLATLTTVDHHSPLYNESNKSGMFYAESWALTHMLYFAPDYRPNFTKFVLLVSNGRSMEEACQEAFHKRMWEVEGELRKYLQGDRFYHAIVDIKLEKSEEEFEVSDAPQFDSDMVLADLLIINKKTGAARSALEQVAKSYPGRPEVEESLGYLAWQLDDEEGARQHFGRAMANGSKNAQMCYQYALLQRKGAASAKDSIVALQRAVELKPDYIEARLQLGQMLMSERNYVQAIGQLTQIKTVKEKEAPYLFSALAYSYMQTGDLDKAKTNAESAKKWAKTPEQSSQAESMLRYIEARRNGGATSQTREGPPVLRHTEAHEFVVEERNSIRNPANPFIAKEDKMSRAEGTAIKLDCSGDSPMLQVRVDGKTMIFEIPDPDRVMIKHAGELKHDFSCGAQGGYKIAVDYAMLPDAKTGSVGIVRGLEF